MISGVTSIILSFVAIIYAFIQSYSSSKQNTTVNITLEKVSDKVDELVTLKTDIADLKENLPYKLSHLIQNIEETKESVEDVQAEGVSKDIIYSRLQELQNSLEDMLSKSNSQGEKEGKEVFLIRAEFNKELESIQINSHIRSVVAQLKRDLHPIKIGLSKSFRNGLEIDFRLNVYDYTIDSEQISKLLKSYPTDLMVVKGVYKMAA